MSSLIRRFVNAELEYLFSNTPFLIFIVSVFITAVAVNMLIFDLIFLVFSLTASNLSVSLLVLTSLLPQIFVSLLGGVIADVKNRKSILFYGNILRSVLVLILFFNSRSVSSIYIVGLLVAIMTNFYIPAEGALLPRFVEKKYLTTANSLFGLSIFGSFLVAYVFGGPISFLLGSSNVFLFISGMFLIPSILVLFIPDHLSLPQVNTKLSISLLPIFEDLKKTFELAYTTRGVFASILMLALSQIVVYIVASLVPGYAKTMLHLKEQYVSVVLFGPASFGMILSALFIERFLKWFSKELLPIVGVVISGVVFILFPAVALVSSLFLKSFLAAIFALCAGFANSLIFVPAQTIIQERVPDEQRSKMYGFLFSITGICSLIPILITGSLADLLGINGVFIVIGLLLIATAVIRNNFMQKE